MHNDAILYKYYSMVDKDISNSHFPIPQTQIPTFQK